MNNTAHNTLPQPDLLPRHRYLQVVQAGLLAKNYRFAREAVLSWLAAYPGDLEAGLYYAQALLAEGHLQQALPVLEGLCLADPLYLQAATVLFQANSALSSQARQTAEKNSKRPKAHAAAGLSVARAALFAISGRSPDRHTMPAWGKDLWLARQALQEGDLLAAEEKIRSALRADPPTPLGAITHLQYLKSNPNIPLERRLELAQRYYERWPDCLACALLLAHWTLESGDSGMAVALLHQVASRDISAQVAGRLWGPDHPYQSLWPQQLACALRQAAPASVTGLLGWNLLPQESKAGSPSFVAETAPAEQEPQALDHIPADLPPLSLSGLSVDDLHLDIEGVAAGQSSVSAKKPAKNRPIQNLMEKRAAAPSKLSRRAKSYQGELRKVQLELERLANGLSQPELSRMDGRFPIYVVLSVRCALVNQYGEQAAAIIENEMERLVAVIGKSQGWGSLLYLPDDLQNTKRLGIKPAKPGDPWELKRALADLDIAMAPRGERIGALLIVGGPEVVPFHHLPNPIGDTDDDVPSDNPYGTRDANYFTQEWPVGRLPAGVGSDPKLLISLLQRLQTSHATRSQRLPWYRRWLQVLFGWLSPNRTVKQSNFGYSAESWRLASAHVFRPIGDPHKLNISPPLGTYEGSVLDSQELARAQQYLAGGVPRTQGYLSYFNLHGVIDSPEWFGQSDPHRSGGYIDYPIALRPEDITPSEDGKQNGLPKVIFSEACYGLHLDGRSTDEAIALKFLQSGSLAIAGCTCMAYGSVNTPLVAADLLGQSFWHLLQDGLPAGEALRQAKIHMVETLDRRQGYLDGMDQKTLISFILYGDPLAQVKLNAATAKHIDRPVSRPLQVKTVCDRCVTQDAGIPAPAEVLDSVRQVVERYLPGMTDAQVAYAPLRERCAGNSQSCSAKECENADGTHPKTFVASGKIHRMVTLSKEVPRAEGVHTHVAHLTLDEGGKLVKLVVSR